MAARALMDEPKRSTSERSQRDRLLWTIFFDSCYLQHGLKRPCMERKYM